MRLTLFAPFAFSQALVALVAVVAIWFAPVPLWAKMGITFVAGVSGMTWLLLIYYRWGSSSHE